MPDEKQLYYIIDSRQIVGNDLLFWAKEGIGYTCNIEEAGLFEKNYSDRETDIQVPREIIEACIVRHVRVEPVRRLMKEKGLEYKGGRIE
jgi:hypothetical protein